MQKAKDNVRKEVLRAAELIFMEKGFPRASMREIADVAGVGLSNIYNYFVSKDEIFCEILKPVTQAFEDTLQKHHGSGRRDMDDMWSADYLRQTTEEYIRIIGRYGRLMELLLFRSQSSSLEKFKERFTDRSTALVKEHAQRMRAEHPELRFGVSDFTIHLHTVWMFTLLEEYIVHRPALRGRAPAYLHRPSLAERCSDRAAGRSYRFTRRGERNQNPGRYFRARQEQDGAHHRPPYAHRRQC